ncbi:unnamed protein product [Angiostrongylus costaricensis]|uniref:Uncharacterized protein n=1 Tax=Angiostrongylus costaricensis TaxID=334426 RepID=A0A3P7HKQ1_ANGCS|nr:unnamed protein product [Angiostrongylus costaricensis]
MILKLQWFRISYFNSNFRAAGSRGIEIIVNFHQCTKRNVGSETSQLDKHICLGDVNIATGLGVYTPIGRLGIRRDFDLALGGSGRSGGRSFGFGNGYQQLVGSVPWA